MRELQNVGLAIVPGVVCVGGFGQFYGEISGVSNLPKRVRKTHRTKATQKTVMTLGQKVTDQNNILTQAFKARHSEMGTISEWYGYGRRQKDRTFRNAGRKPLYKDRKYRASHHVNMSRPQT